MSLSFELWKITLKGLFQVSDACLSLAMMTGWWNNCAGCLGAVFRSINHLLVHDVRAESSRDKVYDQTALSQEAFWLIKATGLEFCMFVVSEFKWATWTVSWSSGQSFICLGNLFHFTTAGYASEQLHVICQGLIFSSKLIWARSLCGEDIHSLISCLCVALINIICWFAFCNHIVWCAPFL